MYPDRWSELGELSKQPSRVLYSVLPEDRSPMLEEASVLDVGKWLDFVVSLLSEDADWEIYTYTLVHLGAQIANETLFANAISQIQALRSLLCEQIKSSSFQEPPGNSSLRKTDVVACIYNILTILLSYDEHFSKADDDELVRTFVIGIGTWETTSNWCIHALNICCHELAPSITKSLESVLHKMSQIITQSRVQMHVLEFLASLSRLSELYKNFREEEYKMIFGICFRFLQTSRDDRDKKKLSNPPPTKSGQGTLRHSAGSRDLSALSESTARTTVPSSASIDLPQYVYALAHHVISFWFLCLKLEDRPKYIKWIIKNLTYTESTGTTEKEVIEEQGIVTIDMLQRTCYTDRDETTRDETFATSSDGEVSKKSWVIGTSIVTIETAGRTGVSQITVRRPVRFVL
jgi:hypothetical protein